MQRWEARGWTWWFGLFSPLLLSLSVSVMGKGKWVLLWQSSVVVVKPSKCIMDDWSNQWAMGTAEMMMTWPWATQNHLNQPEQTESRTVTETTSFLKFILKKNVFHPSSISGLGRVWHLNSLFLQLYNQIQNPLWAQWLAHLSYQMSFMAVDRL